MAFVGAGTHELHLAAFSGRRDASGSALKSARERSKQPHPGAGQLLALAANSTSPQRVHASWSLRRGVFRVCARFALPRAEVPPCLPTTHCSSPLAASLSGQGHLKATAGQTVTSLPCREAPSVGGLVLMASFAQPPVPRGWQVPLGREVLWDKRTWDTLLGSCEVQVAHE